VDAAAGHNAAKSALHPSPALAIVAGGVSRQEPHTAWLIAIQSCFEGAVLTTIQKIGAVNPRVTPILDHSAHWSTRARTKPSAGQNGAAP
jgi:hypothetical protein